MKHLEENLKEHNIHNKDSSSSSHGKTHSGSASAAEAATVNMKNSIRSLREFDKQAGNIYFKNNKNYGDETITNADFKSNNFFFLKFF